MLQNSVFILDLYISKVSSLDAKPVVVVVDVVVVVAVVLRLNRAERSSPQERTSRQLHRSWSESVG